jgi:glycosyltransferase involved in cell wall biosynthesis
LKKSVNWASMIIVPSRATLDAVSAELDARVEKIEIVPWGITNQFRPIDKQEARTYVRENYNIGNEFIMTVGRSYTHKNMVFLFDVYQKLVQEKKFTPDLVFIGEKYWYPVNVEIDKKLRESELKDRFHWLEKISDQDLLNFYNAASVFVFPSRYEGFGFPVLEAMACGVAVVSSTSTSLPEVLGDAGLMYAPDDMEGFSRGIWRLYSDDRFRNKMIKLGLERAKEFDWNLTAQQILNIYEKILEQE